jgi:hypothetical protein
MLIALIVGVILYYIALFRKFRKDSQKGNPKQASKLKMKTEIIGKSTYRLGQEKPSKAIDRQLYKAEENDYTFAPPDENNSPNLLDVEFKMEYDDELTDEELEAEEIACFMGEETPPAQGISFEEMAQAVEVLQQISPPEKEERQAVQTFSKMEQTGLFDTMMKQLENGRQKVTQLLNRYDAVLVAESIEDEISDFDINNYM